MDKMTIKEIQDYAVSLLKIGVSKENILNIVLGDLRDKYNVSDKDHAEIVEMINVTMNDNFKNFKDYLRTGKTQTPRPATSEGGYAIPQFITVKKAGVIAWFFRLFGSKRGYEQVDMYKMLQDKPAIKTQYTVNLNGKARRNE